ncbi:hypothetical protein [Caulobacter sp. S45]|uniref:hypothetical protein n=1 Tax=Caulobacter sp. S45 TaxID=1641861 RepID=UPI001575D790|nr:hypothetical protein [Caulobacter sp. S45]
MADGDLTTLENVKAWLPDMAQVTTSDALLARLITAASQAVCVYTGRPGFDVQAYGEVYDGSGWPTLVLRQWPVVEVDGVSFADGSAPPGYTLEPAVAGGGAQRLSLTQGVFPRGLANVTVAYRTGYPATPPDVEQAVIELVGERFRARDRIGLSAKTLGGQETAAFATKAFNDTIAALLAPYRRVCPW